jgi:WXXGXW repeat (2 copies)
MKLRSLVLAGFLFVALPLSPSFAQVGISINLAPPPLPIEVQPPVPVAGYIWTPGYWAWGVSNYYWVPGIWVPPPTVGLLWTPPWWGWANGAYVFNDGYWGPTVGFYGGINYGYGYWGDGYWGGRWEGNTFRYNTAVTHVNNTFIHNTYVDRSVMKKEVNRSHTSFNGPNGVKAEATAEQKAAEAHKIPPTSQQLARQEAASKDRNLQASVNKGHLNPDAIKSFNQSHEHGKGAEGLGAGAGAGNAEHNTGNLAEHHAQGARMTGEEHGNRHEAENVHGNRHNVQGNQAKAHTGQGMEHRGPAHGPYAMNQQMGHHPQMGAQHHPQQMRPQHHAQMGGPPNRGGHPPPRQQQGKKKENKR